MWTRKFLKDRAKAVLRVSYWKAFLVSLIIAFMGGGRSFNFSYNLGNNSHRSSVNNYTLLPGFDLGVFMSIMAIILAIGIFIFLFALAFRIFLGFPLEVSGRYYFIHSAYYDSNLNYIGFGFGRGRYWNIVKTMLWKAFLNFLWYLLFIIPGIVKYYAYMMVPYILADNPNMNYERAVELSKEMTSGHKFDMWVLDLSFIGWYLLGTVLLLVGVLFVMPYENATKAELYLVLRQNALNSGICTYEELNLCRPSQPTI